LAEIAGAISADIGFVAAGEGRGLRRLRRRAISSEISFVAAGKRRDFCPLRG